MASLGQGGVEYDHEEAADASLPKHNENAMVDQKDDNKQTRKERRKKKAGSKTGDDERNEVVASFSRQVAQRRNLK